MSKVTFIYEGSKDEYENGKRVEYSFGDGENPCGMTWDTLCDHFDYFLKSIGYVYDGKVTVVRDDY